MVRQGLYDPALAMRMIAAVVEHAFELTLQGAQAPNAALDFGQPGARDVVHASAWFCRVTGQLQQLADGVEWKAQLACVANEGKPLQVDLVIAPLVSGIPAWLVQQTLGLIKPDGCNLSACPFSQFPDGVNHSRYPQNTFLNL